MILFSIHAAMEVGACRQMNCLKRGTMECHVWNCFRPAPSAAKV